MHAPDIFMQCALILKLIRSSRKKSQQPNQPDSPVDATPIGTPYKVCLWGEKGNQKHNIWHSATPSGQIWH